MLEWNSPSIDPILQIVNDPESNIVDLLSDKTVFKFVKDKNPDVVR